MIKQSVSSTLSLILLPYPSIEESPYQTMQLKSTKTTTYNNLQSPTKSTTIATYEHLKDALLYGKEGTITLDKFNRL
jgi:hypothetical protein